MPISQTALALVSGCVPGVTGGKDENAPDLSCGSYASGSRIKRPFSSIREWAHGKPWRAANLNEVTRFRR